MRNAPIFAVGFNNLICMIMDREHVDSRNLISVPEDYVEMIKSMSDILRETLYLLDFHSQRIRFLTVNDMFLNIFTPNETLLLKEVFYRRIVHPDDMSLVFRILQLVSEYWSHSGTRLSYLRCMTFNFRICNHERDLMVHHCMKPYFADSDVRAAFCSISVSTMQKSGNLTAYYSDSENCHVYSFEKKQWQSKPVLLLTGREKEILKLAKQGVKDAACMADKLHLSKHTVRNQREQLFRKLNVHSMEEAIIFAINHHLIFG
jgi:DNA-binding CsgD family transcriptional regulator